MNKIKIMASAKKHQNAGDGSLWKLCCLANYVVEHSDRGHAEETIMEFANTIRRTNRTVYNMHAAVIVFKGLHKEFLKLVSNFPGRHYWELRQLPYKHFLIIGRLMIKYDIAPLETLHYLFDALDHNYSSERLERDVIAEQNGGNEDISDNSIERKTNHALGILEDISTVNPGSEMSQAISLAVDTVRSVTESIGKNRPVWFPIALTIRSTAMALAQRNDIPEKLCDILVALGEAIEQIFDELDISN